MKSLNDYNQYKKDIFTKLDFNFERGKKLLDVGCGDCVDAEIFKEVYGLDVYGTDIYEHENVGNILNDKFELNEQGVFDMKYERESFDYVFMHDVLHHVDEESQSYDKHIVALKNCFSLVKPDGYLIIVEGNRFNPLFYPHMVKMLGHEHFSQRYFKKLINDAFKSSSNPTEEEIKFKFFEAHAYPYLTRFFKIYEFIMENFIPKTFLAYNIAFIKK